MNCKKFVLGFTLILSTSYNYCSFIQNLAGSRVDWLFLDLALSAWNPKCRKANNALLRNLFAKISFCTKVYSKKLLFSRIFQPHMVNMLQLPHFWTFFHKIFSGVSTNLVRCYTEKFMKFHIKIKCTELFVLTCSLHFSFFFHFGGLYRKKIYYNFFF